MSSGNGVVLSAGGVSTTFFTHAGEVEAVRDVSLDLHKGRMLGLVGETGCGKSVLVHSLVNQVRFPGKVTGGEVLLDGEDLLSLDERSLRRVRGRRIAIIGSNPGASLDPLTTIGDQLGRAITAHEKVTAPEATARAVEALESVGIPDPERRKDAHPHELSVGMAQRVLIAMALLHSPDVIIADELTAGLDVTVQRQVLNLLRRLLADLGSATMIVTRDLGIVAQYCDDLAVMRDGSLVEHTPVVRFFDRPNGEYSRDLLGRVMTSAVGESAPAAASGAAEDPAAEPLLAVRDLVKYFPVRGARHLRVHAVNGVSFEVGRGEALGLVGESGSGKTTVGRLVLRLIEPTGGSIDFAGERISEMSEADMRPLRSRIQMVFQEPHASLNPSTSVARNIDEPLRVGGMGRRERNERVREVLGMVHLSEADGDKFPHQLSAGQAQRAGIARAIGTEPDLVVLDEPTSQLDIAIRAEIIDLLNEISDQLGMAYLFISHDLTAVRSVCSRIAVMYLGKIVEAAPTAELFADQRHPYSKALLSSVLYPDPAAALPDFRLEAEIPSPIHLPTGCHLHPRCPLATAECAVTYPPLVELSAQRHAACYRSDVLVATPTTREEGR
ncbi:MAG: ABC transporter ATP-binding protein [bacterium]|nr:ABC transporter ATP-binding protein [bacterium]